MRRTIIISLLAVVLLIVMAVGSSSFAREAPEKEKKLTKNKVFLSPTGDDPALSLLNINNMTYWVKFNGESAHSRNDDSGIVPNEFHNELQDLIGQQFSVKLKLP